MATKKRQGFVLYHEIRKPLAILTDEQRGRLFLAILDYSEHGEIPEFGDMALDLAFAFIRQTMDNGAEKWAETSEKRAAAGSAGGKQRVANALQAKQTQANASKPSKSSELELELELEHELEPEQKDKGRAEARPRSPEEVAHKRGNYGWVKLTDKQYEKLLADLGEEELNRCITYIDESAQKTGNKNKWRDWNLVIRSCHREQWGMRQAPARRNKITTAEEYKAPEAIDNSKLAAVMNVFGMRG